MLGAIMDKNGTSKKEKSKLLSSALELARPAAVLLVISAIVSAALAFTYAATKDEIALGSKKEADALRAQVMADVAFEPVDLPAASSQGDEATALELFRAIAADGSLAGYVATASAKGYNGDVTVIVGVRQDGSISGVRVSGHTETPGVGTNAVNDEFCGQYDGGLAGVPFEAVKRGAGEQNEISAVSGATITSNAVTNAVNAATSAAHAMLQS
jgi:electron transport complex protein RnfG